MLTCQPAYLSLTRRVEACKQEDRTREKTYSIHHECMSFHLKYDDDDGYDGYDDGDDGDAIHANFYIRSQTYACHIRPC